MLRLKSKDKAAVMQLQTALNKYGFKLIVDGDFGRATLEAVKHFQQESALVVDGIAGATTLKALGINTGNRAQVAIAEWHRLPTNEYVNKKSKKYGICLHHTVTDGNPHKVQRLWDYDKNGRIATHFVIGREMLNGDKEFDGKVLQLFDLDYWAYHLGLFRYGNTASNRNSKLNKAYIGIEICALGYLKKIGNKYFDGDHARIEVPAEQVLVLEDDFRTFKYWHKYTDKQIESLETLICQLVDYFGFDLNIDRQKGPVTEDWLDCKEAVWRRKRVLTTHTQFELWKYDCFPQPELNQMLTRIYKKYCK